MYPARNGDSGAALWHGHETRLHRTRYQRFSEAAVRASSPSGPGRSAATTPRARVEMGGPSPIAFSDAATQAWLASGGLV